MKRSIKSSTNVVTLSQIPIWQNHDSSSSNQRSTNNYFNSKISLYRGDITKLKVDAIVNAANTSLLGGGGVDGCIHRAAGAQLLQECKTLKGCDTGKAKITKGYNLPARFIIHTVGPRGEHPNLLRSCYNECFRLMKENNMRSIAFPCISGGIYGYSTSKSCPVVLNVVKQFLEEQRSSNIERIVFCVFEESDYNVYYEHMKRMFPLE